MTLPPARPGPIDWPRIDRRILAAYQGLKPQDIDQMTLSEIAVYCMPDGDGPPGGRSMSRQEIEADIRAARAMTPLQRIRKARRRRDGHA